MKDEKKPEERQDGDPPEDGEAPQILEKGDEEGADKDIEEKEAIIPQLIGMAEDKGEERAEEKQAEQGGNNPEHYDEDGDNPVLINEDKNDGRYRLHRRHSQY